MTTKLLEPVKIQDTLYYFDPDIFGTLDDGEPCVNLNGDGRGYLKATIQRYYTGIAGATYKIWASSDPKQVWPRITVKELEEYNSNPYTLLVVEIDDRDRISSGEKGFLAMNPMKGQPMVGPGGFVIVTNRLYNLHKPFQIFEVDHKISAYQFLSEGGFSMIADGNYHTFVINGIGYRLNSVLEISKEESDDKIDWKEKYEKWNKIAVEDMDKKVQDCLRLRAAFMEISALLPINSNILLSRKIEGIIKANL